MVKRSHAKRRGTRTEYSVRDMFREAGWAVIRSGGSLGPVDLVCMKEGDVALVQVKRKAGRPLYIADGVPQRLQGFRVMLVVDFGRGNLRVTPRRHKVKPQDGIPLREFLASHRAGRTGQVCR